VEAVLRDGPATAAPTGERSGGGLLVNVSRAIAGVARRPSEGRPEDVGERLAEAAAGWARQLPVLP